MKLQRTSVDGEPAKESTIHDCIAALDKIICAVFDFCGENAFKAKLRKVIGHTKKTLDNFPNHKFIKSLDFLMMINEAAEDKVGIEVDFTLYAENPSADVRQRASTISFRVDKLKDALSGRLSFFKDLRESFEETTADRLYNLLRTKADLNPYMQPVNFVLYQNKRIDSALMPFNSTPKAHLDSKKLKKRHDVKGEDGNIESLGKASEEFTVMRAQNLSLHKRVASLLAAKDRATEERRQSRSRMRFEISTLRDEKDKLLDEVATLREETQKLRAARQNEAEAQAELHSQNDTLSARCDSMVAENQQLRENLQAVEDAVNGLRSQASHTAGNVRKHASTDDESARKKPRRTYGRSASVI